MNGIATSRISVEEALMLGTLLRKGVPLALAKTHFSCVAKADCHTPLAGLETHLPKKLLDNVLFFLQYGSLGHAIYCSAQVALEQNRIKKEMLKKLQYPCLLLLLCCIVCSLFGFVVLPQLHAMQFDTPMYGVIQALQLIQVLVLTTIFLLMGSIVVFLLLSKSDHVGAVECTQRLFGFTVVKQWMTLLFVQHLEAVMQIETSTKNALQILHHHPNKALRKMAAQLEAGLLQGDDYGEVFAKREWVDPMLLRYVTYGLQGDCLPSMLGSYSQMTMALWQRRFLRFGQLMQWIAYGFCAANMIVAYQVLLEPLALLERM